MSQSASYFKIGMFVLVAAALVVFLLILAGAGIFQPASRDVETYIDTSVQGLTVGAPVKFRGVIIGKVDEIGFTTGYYEEKLPRMERKNYVLVRMSVDKKALDEFGKNINQSQLNQEVERGLRARQQSSGLTGISYMEIDYMDPLTNKILPITWDPEELYIPSAPSDMSRLLKAAEEVFKKLEKIDVEGVVTQTTNLLGELRESNASLGSAISSFDGLISSGQVNLEESLSNIRATTGNIRDLTDTLKHDPSQIIFSSPPPPAKSVEPPTRKKK